MAKNPSKNEVFLHGMKPTGDRLRRLIAKYQTEGIKMETDWDRWKTSYRADKSPVWDMFLKEINEARTIDIQQEVEGLPERATWYSAHMDDGSLSKQDRVKCLYFTVKCDKPK